MRNALASLRRFAREDDGAAMVEYTILLGIITVAVIGTVIMVGGYVSTAWDSLCDNLGATCAAPAAAGG